MREDADRWNARYAGRAAGAPSAPKGLDGFDGVVPAHGESLCLDIACGTGEQSMWAARNGFRVLALDVSPVAIDALRRSAVEARLEHLIDARIVDLDDGLPADVNGLCSLVVCQRFRDPRLYPAIAGAARPGGLIVVTVLSCVGLSGDAGPFHAAPGELVVAFGALDVDIVRSIEGEGEATLVARRR